MIPEWILDAEISDRAVRLYALLARYANDQSIAFPGRRKLAERLRVTLPTLDKAIKELVDGGAMEVVPRYRDNGGQTTNDYVMHFDPAKPGDPPEESQSGGGEPSVLGPHKEREPVVERESENESAQPANAGLASASREIAETLPPLFNPNKPTLIEGRNLPFDALVEECKLDPRSPRLGDVAVALNGQKSSSRPGIREMFLAESERYNESREQGADGVGRLHFLLRERPELFEFGLAEVIRRKADLYRQRMPDGAMLTPTALAKWWLDLETMEGRTGLTAEEMMKL